MIKHKDRNTGIQKILRRNFKNIDRDSLPTHHGIEWAKIIVDEHMKMGPNEANLAEMQELYQALEIIEKHGEKHYFYI